MERNAAKIVKVFIASPSDVSEERKGLDGIVDEVNTIISDYSHIVFQVVKWEKNNDPQMGRPQEIINKLLLECDLFFGILWHRFGSPTGGLYNGSKIGSGTEEEFRLAYESWNRKKAPDICFFRCMKVICPGDIKPNQLAKVDNFFKNFSYDKEHPGIYEEYCSIKEFEATIRRVLIKYALNHKLNFCSLESQKMDTLSKRAKEAGMVDLYLSRDTNIRNSEKRNSIKSTCELKLIAHSGYSFLARFGRIFRDVIIEKLSAGCTFQLVLSNPWSTNAFFLALGEKTMQEIVMERRYSQNNIIGFESPEEKIKNSIWYSEKFINSISGYIELKERFPDQIKMRLSKYEMTSTIMITDNECYIEPYFPTGLIERHEKGMSAYEIKFLSNSKMYELSIGYFNLLWELSEEISSYNDNIQTYIEVLKRTVGV